MSSPAELIARLMCAANADDLDREIEDRQLLTEAVVAVREMLTALKISDPFKVVNELQDIYIAAASLGARAESHEEVRTCLLQATGMIWELDQATRLAGEQAISRGRSCSAAGTPLTANVANAPRRPPIEDGQKTTTASVSTQRAEEATAFLRRNH